MDLGFNSLTGSAIGAVVIMLAGANVAQWKEIRRLNTERLKDAKDITTENQRVIKGVTRALTNLNRKIDGKS